MTQKLVVLALAIRIILPAQTQPEKFETASIRIAPDRGPCAATNQAGCSNFGAWGTAGYTATYVRLEILVSIAYGVSDNQISGADRLGNSHYDISAKPEAGVVTYARAQPMLKALLEERFGLVVHRETKQGSGYALVIAKGGPKLKESPPDAKPTGIIDTGLLSGAKITLDGIASLLSRPLDRRVVNETGLAGNYDLNLKFAPEGAEPSTTIPSIFTAVQEQLGLKLESRKVPVEILVIDRCEPIPTEN